MLESQFQAKLIREIKDLFPDAIVFKNDAKQGLPDILILYEKTWAALECKKQEGSPHRPNQDYYVDRMNNMSFAAFVYPENKEEILNCMRKYFVTN